MPQDSALLPGLTASPRPQRAAPRSDRPALLSLATAVPPIVLHQADVIARAATLFDGRKSDIERLMPVFENAGIATRYSCVPLDWYERDHGWAERNRLYIDHALDLLEHAAQACLDRAGLAAGDIDAIVTVSTTGIATPSLDARLMERLSVRRDAVRLPIFGLGCAGGVLGLSRAASLAQSMPGARVLFLVVELCALTFRKMDQSKSNIIAAALFGDGAAAALIGPPADGGAAAPPPVIEGGGEYTWPDSLDVMGWHIEDDGLGVLFSRDIPTLVRTQFRPVLDRFLTARGLSLLDIDGFACHPGGVKVIAALEEAFALAPGSLEIAREVLAQYGNMSAVTVLFVLERLLAARRRRERRGRVLMSALGPGFSAGFLTLSGA
ncbi:MAG TPA: 3-oxoacyl-[acyl-carrier-protein] synthase III C-terminal domain-containing protein [Alphaproteobacteria bacterium]|nr:3-oxoacyl-[acyl-carrier-protein] synthase III C-terminal domain-containing protein [Alphaproteobacteria bacterium]